MRGLSIEITMAVVGTAMTGLRNRTRLLLGRFVYAAVLMALCAVLGIGGLGSASNAVKEIRISGNMRIQKEAILKNIQTRIGDLYSRTKIRSDLKAIYNMGFFKDIQIDVEDTSSGKIVTYQLTEKEYLERLEIDGNESVSESDIKDKVKLEFPMLYDEKVIQDAVEKIRKLYHEKGFYLASLSYSVAKKDNASILKVEVREGNKVTVKRINIIGNHQFSVDEIKDIMITREEGPFSFMTSSGRFDEELFLDADIRRIQYLYLQNGYADIKIQTPKGYLTPDRKYIFISIVLEEGPQYRVGSIDVKGDMDYIPDRARFIREEVKLKEGEIWDIRKQQDDIQEIQDLYGEHGYAYANCTPDIKKNEADRLLHVTYVIGKGERVHFGFVDILGNFDTRDRVIRRELEFTEGELFNIKKFRESKRNLERLGYFEEVKFIQKDRIEEKKIDVTIEVKEKSTGSIQLGATFSSFDSYGGFAQLQKVNLFGLGYDISLSAQISLKSQLFAFMFRNPRVYDSELSMTLNAFNREYTNPDGTSITERGGSVAFSYPILKSYYLGWSYGLQDVSLDYQRIIREKFPDSTGLKSEVGLSLTRDTLDVRPPFLPSTGSSHGIYTDYATRYIGSDLSYWRLGYTGKQYYTLFPEKYPVIGGSVVGFSLRLGYVQGVDGQRTPFGERYFPGGLFSIRGHYPRSLGPELDSAYPLSGKTEDEMDPALTGNRKLKVGGNKQAIFNIEYLFMIFREANIRGVFFFDAGNAFIEGEWLEAAKIRYSAGFGIRWFSPIGPLRFEWGFPLDKKKGEDQITFDFSIGSPF